MQNKRCLHLRKQIPLVVPSRTESPQWPATLCARPDPEILAFNGIVADIDLEGTYHVWIPFNCADAHDE